MFAHLSLISILLLEINLYLCASQIRHQEENSSYNTAPYMLQQFTLSQLLQLQEEEDHIELKEAKRNFSYNGHSITDPSSRRKCLLGYMVALCNEGEAHSLSASKNVFVKPNEQNRACSSYAMARKGRMKSNTKVAHTKW